MPYSKRLSGCSTAPYRFSYVVRNDEAWGSIPLPSTKFFKGWPSFLVPQRDFLAGRIPHCGRHLTYFNQANRNGYEHCRVNPANAHLCQPPKPFQNQQDRLASPTEKFKFAYTFIPVLFADLPMHLGATSRAAFSENQCTMQRTLAPV
jgi:hypothetical protein